MAQRICTLRRLPRLAGVLLALWFGLWPCGAVMRDGGIDPANLGQGGWLYLLHNATNHLSPNNISAVTNENSLFKYLKGQSLDYVIVKAGSADAVYYDSTYSTRSPVFNSNLVYLAHANGLKIFGSNRSWGSNIVGEIAITDFVFQQGADGFIWDAESEWESGASHPWITNGPAQAWWLCGTVRSNWPTKFLAHNPYDTLYLHSSFPYKEFGYWADCTMPQVYHHSASQGNAFAAIHWTDVNYAKWQSSLAGSSSVVNGQTIYWTNSIKPLVLMRDVYGANFSPAYPPQDVMNFIDYLAADPNGVTAGGYRGADYFRSELHDTAQWAYIRAATIGNQAGQVNNLVLDDARASVVSTWTMVKTIDATTSTVNFYGALGTDTNSFGTNYFCKGQGTGAAYLQFTPNVLVPGDYNVYQWHPSRADASASTPFIINHSRGLTTVYANQQNNDGNWSLLGRFNFLAGTSGSIRVSDAIPESTGVAMADAIKLVFMASNPGPADLVLDNTNLEVSFNGAWQTGTGSTDKYGADYRFASTVLGGTSNGIYRPNIATAGKYDVYLWYPQGSNRATNASWQVVYNGGFTNVGVNQTVNGGTWRLLAAGLPFWPGTSGYVQVSNDSPQPGAVVMADAVRFAWSATQDTAPQVTASPTNQTVTAGANAFFNVQASGTPLNYQWRLYGTNLASATTSSYTRLNAQLTDGGPYSVVVSNTAGMVTSATALLTVNAAPFISPQPQSVTTNAGANVAFLAFASGNPQPVFQWRFNGGDIPGATATAYSLNSVQPADAGSYSFLASNTVGVVTSAEAVLTVVRPSIESIEQLLGQGYQLHMRGGPGRFAVEVTTNLTAWTQLTTLSATGLVFEYLDPDQTQTNRFYRVRGLP